jgi:hypothetical protein
MSLRYRCASGKLPCSRGERQLSDTERAANGHRVPLCIVESAAPPLAAVAYAVATRHRLSPTEDPGKTYADRNREMSKAKAARLFLLKRVVGSSQNQAVL